MSSKSDKLKNARESKNDEFYTRLEDIEMELRNYKDLFEDKVVFCNCDDPYESNFFKYFALNFNALKLKKLIATCHQKSKVAGKQLSLFDFDDEKNEIKNVGRKAYKIEINSVDDINKDGAEDLGDIELLLKSNKNVKKLLKGDGDFRSDECLKLLEESDIVVTNPPFSLFREFISLLDYYDKKFIIIGNTNALAYKEVFNLFKQDKIRTGYTNFNVGMYFFVPNDWEQYHKIVDGRKMVRVSTSCWYTNMPVKKHTEKLILYKKYEENEYIHYDNFDAIEVGSYLDIPCDYYGYMGVPITFLDKYNPKQFKIIGMGTGDTAKQIGVQRNYRGRTDLAYTKDGKPSCPYNRIIIQRNDIEESESVDHGN